MDMPLHPLRIKRLQESLGPGSSFCSRFHFFLYWILRCRPGASLIIYPATQRAHRSIPRLGPECSRCSDITTVNDIARDGKFAVKIIPRMHSAFLGSLVPRLHDLHPATVGQKAAGLLRGSLGCILATWDTSRSLSWLAGTRPAALRRHSRL